MYFLIVGKLLYNVVLVSAVCVLVVQSCPTLCDPIDYSLPGSSVHEISRQEYWSGLPFPSPGDLPDPGIKPGSLALQADCLPSKSRFLSFNTNQPWLYIYPLPGEPPSHCSSIPHLWVITEHQQSSQGTSLIRLYESSSSFCFLVYFWFHWVFVAAHGLFIVVWGLLCSGFACCAAQDLGVQASVVTASGLNSCSVRL